MLVFGDARRACSTAAFVERVRAAQSRGDSMGAFVAASGLAQGALDAEFEGAAQDELTALHLAAVDLLAGVVRGQPAEAELEALRRLSPEQIEVTTPEGYAFYAVYPQAYRLAAARIAWETPPLVIGLRSIGTGLAAVVTEATGAPVFVTLRPTGDPFAREVRAGPALKARLAAHGGPFAIVDEGPGLSGSSFGAAADLLEDLGVEPGRIVFLPSHGGPPGPQANPRHRDRWRTARRAVATLDDLLVEEPLADWFADFTGADVAVEDLSAGGWRRLVGSAPPADPPRERRKFRLTSPRGAWIARFAGLGSIGEAKLARAQALHAAGFAPEPLALRRGFLLQRWQDGDPLDVHGAERGRFLAHLARYLAFRARAFPAAPDEGADGDALAAMVERNAGLRLQAPPFGPRVHVDGRLQAWEWLRRADGSFCKLDALDHSCAHDLIGAQDIAWDVAGAVAEFKLTTDEAAGLVAGLARSGGPPIPPRTLAFLDVCYAAFHLGLWTLAGSAPGAAAERRRYQARLGELRGGAV